MAVKPFKTPALPGGAKGPKRIAGAILAAVVGLIVLSSTAQAVTYEAVPVDKIALHYTGGPIQGQHFVEVVSPGSKPRFYGIAEKLFLLPSTQRTYLISRDPSVGDRKVADQILGTSSDNVQFSFEAVVYFKLNMRPPVLRQFFEQICLHDGCTDLSAGGGWDRMLLQYFRPAVESAIRAETGKYTREQLWHDPSALAAIQGSIGNDLHKRINAAVGGEYFCGPDSSPASCSPFGFILKDPQPPQVVIDAYAQTAAAQQQVETSKRQADAKVAAARGEADAQRERAAAPALTQAQIDYINAQAGLACAQNPNCTMIIGGAGNVNVNTGGK